MSDFPPVKRLSKPELYFSRIMSVEYDLEGMICAYGPEAIHWLVDRIAAGQEIDRKDIAKFPAYKDLYKFASTSDKRKRAVIIDKTQKIVKRGSNKPKQLASA